MSKKKKTIKKNSKQTYMEKKTAIAGILRDRKTSPKKERKKVNLSLKQITVKNAEGDPDTTATILVQNQIDYVPKVSVIIPVYNVEQYLRECLDSVVNQTLTEIEIICVDDGSTDSSLEILKEYAKKDKRISLLSQNNYYGGVARNAGLNIAKGKYVHFLDSDDMYPNEFVLEHLYKTAVKNKVLICGGTMNQLKNGKILPDPKFNFEKEGIIDFYEYQFIYGYWRFIYDKEFLKAHQILFPKRKRFQDPPFFIRAMHQAGFFYALNEPTYLYRIIVKSKNYFNGVVSDIAHGMKDVLDYAKENNLEKIYNDLYVRIHTKFMKEMLSQKSDSGETYIEKIGPKVLFDEKLESAYKVFEKNILISKLQNREYFRYLSTNPDNVDEYAHITQRPECAFIHGSGTWSPQPETVAYAIENNIPLIKVEDGFLRSADTWCNHTVDKKYTMGISYMFTNDVFYFDATRSSYMERQINNPNFHLTKEQKVRAQKAIKTIINNHLTKYNHQPIFEPKIGREGVPKILVIDQSYGDFSIKQGLADDNTFMEMLEAAIKENPNADVIVKTHPDAIAPGTKRPLGYYSTLKEHDNLYILREPINPISLIKYIDKVYVCTTQFGFEALMCGKEVHTFGMPFYAGWGVTIDKLKNPRRTAKRTLEEIFYIAYIKNTYYVDPVNKCPCNIERAMEYLIELREEYKKYLKQPRVSVIIPVYNVERYLRECLDSVINQTLKNIEIICVNDGSSDNSLAILKEYVAKDNRIKLYENQVNKGLGFSRNLGIQKAKGKYIFFLDSDDFIDSETLETLHNETEKVQAQLCQYRLCIYDDKLEKRKNVGSNFYDPIRKIFTYSWKSFPQLLFKRVEAPLKLYERDFLLKNNIKFFEGCYFEDTIVHIRCMSLAKEICFVDKAYYSYRKNREGQITGNSENTDKFLDIFNYINEAEKFFKEQNMWKEIKQYYYAFAMERICLYYVQCNNKTKIKFVKKVALWVKNKKLSELKQSCPEKFDQFYSILAKNNIVCSVIGCSLSESVKSYIFFPYYILFILFLKKKMKSLKTISKNKPSKLFSIVKTPYKKVYRFLGLKWVSHNRHAELTDLIRQNQAKTLDIFNEIKTHNTLLEKKTVELEKQLSLVQKQLK